MTQTFAEILEKTSFQEGLVLLEQGKNIFALTKQARDSFLDYLAEDVVPVRVTDMTVEGHEGWLIEFDFSA